MNKRDFAEDVLCYITIPVGTIALIVYTTLLLAGVFSLLFN